MGQKTYQGEDAFNCLRRWRAERDISEVAAFGANDIDRGDCGYGGEGLHKITADYRGTETSDMDPH